MVMGVCNTVWGSFEALEGAQALSFSARNVTLKVESGLEMRCGTRDAEIERRERRKGGWGREKN